MIADDCVANRKVGRSVGGTGGSCRFDFGQQSGFMSGEEIKTTSTVARIEPKRRKWCKWNSGDFAMQILGILGKTVPKEENSYVTAMLNHRCCSLRGYGLYRVMTIRTVTTDHAAAEAAW
jgi:hypothetical protein